MEKKYVAPEIKVIEFEMIEDIIQTSGTIKSTPKMFDGATGVAEQNIDVFEY